MGSHRAPIWWRMGLYAGQLREQRRPLRTTSRVPTPRYLLSTAQGSTT
jgi:hypothetical protein